MSQKSGDKSRNQINRKRAVVRRAKIRELVATGQINTVPRPRKPLEAESHAEEPAAAKAD